MSVPPLLAAVTPPDTPRRRVLTLQRPEDAETSQAWRNAGRSAAEGKLGDPGSLMSPRECEEIGIGLTLDWQMCMRHRDSPQSLVFWRHR